MPIRPMFRSPLTAAVVALAMFSTTACSTTTDPAAGSPTNNQSDRGNGGKTPMDAKVRNFSMTPGETTALAGGGQLRYLRMVNDSRCKPDVQCIWEGDAELSFQWQKDGGGQDTFSLHTSSRIGDKDHLLGTQRLTLLSLARGDAPEAQLRLEPGS